MCIEICGNMFIQLFFDVPTSAMPMANIGYHWRMKGFVIWNRFFLTVHQQYMTDCRCYVHENKGWRFNWSSLCSLGPRDSVHEFICAACAGAFIIQFCSQFSSAMQISSHNHSSHCFHRQRTAKILAYWNEIVEMASSLDTILNSYFE